jgi:hypothetical protein
VSAVTCATYPNSHQKPKEPTRNFNLTAKRLERTWKRVLSFSIILGRANLDFGVSSFSYVRGIDVVFKTQ